jgi:hypothetical protein
VEFFISVFFFQTRDATVVEHTKNLLARHLKSLVWTQIYMINWLYSVKLRVQLRHSAMVVPETLPEFFTKILQVYTGIDLTKQNLPNAIYGEKRAKYMKLITSMLETDAERRVTVTKPVRICFVFCLLNRSSCLIELSL